MSGKAISPAEKRQRALFKGMTEAAQKLTRSVEDLLREADRNWVVARWQVGRRINDAIRAKDTDTRYGVTLVDDLAEYLGPLVQGGGQGLHTWIRFATAFSLDFVSEQMRKPLENGSPLNFGHWKVLARVEDSTKHPALLDRVRAENWNAMQLEEYLQDNDLTARRHGGRRRPPTVPSSLPPAFRKLLRKTNGLINYVEKAEAVLGSVATVAEEEVSAALVDDVEQALATVDTVSRQADHLREVLTPGLERIKQIRDKHYDQAVANLEGDGEAAPVDADAMEDEVVDVPAARPRGTKKARRAAAKAAKARRKGKDKAAGPPRASRRPTAAAV